MRTLLRLTLAGALLVAGCGEKTPATPASKASQNAESCERTLAHISSRASAGYSRSALRLLETKCPKAQSLKVEILVKSGRLEEARKLVQAGSIQLSPEATAAIDAAEKEQAERKQTGSEAGDKAATLLEEAQTAFANGKLEAALTASERSVSATYPNADAWLLQARILQAQGQEQRARLAFERGLSESDSPAQRELGIPEPLKKQLWIGDHLHLRTENHEFAVVEQRGEVELVPVQFSPQFSDYITGSGKFLVTKKGEASWILEQRFGQEGAGLEVDFRPHSAAANDSFVFTVQIKDDGRFKRVHAFERTSGKKSHDFGLDRPGSKARVLLDRLFAGPGWVAVYVKEYLIDQGRTELRVFDDRSGKFLRHFREDTILPGQHRYCHDPAPHPNGLEVLFHCDGTWGGDQQTPAEHPAFPPAIWALNPKTGALRPLLKGDDLGGATITYDQNSDLVALLNERVRVLKRTPDEWQRAGIELEDSFYRDEYWRDVAFSPDSQQLVASNEEKVSVWDLQTGKRKWTLNIPTTRSAGLTRVRTYDDITAVQRCDKILVLNWQDGARLVEAKGVSCGDSYLVWRQGEWKLEQVSKHGYGPPVQVVGALLLLGECFEVGRCRGLRRNGEKLEWRDRSAPIALTPDGDFAFSYDFPRKRLVVWSIEGHEEVVSWSLAVDSPMRVLNSGNGRLSAVLLEDGWRTVERPEGDGPLSFSTMDMSRDAVDLNDDGSRYLGPEGVCDHHGACTPLEGFDAKLRTTGSNWHPVLASVAVALRFANHGRLVVGVSASQLDVWSASTGKHHGTYKATRSGDWIFVGPGNAPLEQRSLEFLPRKEALNSMMCTVGEEWFPWDLCEAAFADKWLDDRGLPLSLEDR